MYLSLVLFSVSLLVASVHDCKAQEVTFMRDGSYYVERTHQRYSVDGAGTLTLDADFGSVRVESWSNDEVDVAIEKRRMGIRENDARDAFEDVTVDVARQGNDVDVRIDRTRSFGSDKVSVNIQLRIPEYYRLDLKTSGGDIDVGDLRGDVLAHTSGGNVNIGNVTEASIQVHTSGGDISVRGGGRETKVSTSGGDIKIRTARGAVDARTSGGDIKISNTTGGVTATTSGGDITIGAAMGGVTAKTSGGDVTIDGVRGEVDVHTSGGDVEIDHAEGNLKASTSGGDITIGNATGGVTAKTSGGDIEAGLKANVSALEKEWSLQSTGGELTIRIPEDLSATVEAEIHLERSWFGRDRDYRIDSDFDLDEKDANTRNRRTISATGDINSGGTRIRLVTRGGDIQIRKVRSS